jgi:hypothetical protein
MSRCRQFDDAIWDTAHGQSAPPELAEHLLVCESCRRSLRSLSAAAQGFAALRTVSAPDPRPAVWARLAKPRRQGLRLLAWSAGIAVCALAAAMVLWHGFSRQSGSAPHPASTVAQVSPEKHSPPPVDATVSAHQADAPAPTQELRDRQPPPSIDRDAPGVGDDRPSAPQQPLPVVVPAGPNGQPSPDAQVAEAPAVSERSPDDSTTDRSDGKRSEFVNRMIGMALATSLLQSANGTG